MPRDPQPCTTCDRPWAEDEFYEGCSECKVCKRQRSKDHRLLQARKIAAVERLVDVLVTLSTNAGIDGARQDAGGV